MLYVLNRAPLGSIRHADVFTKNNYAHGPLMCFNPLNILLEL